VCNYQPNTIKQKSINFLLNSVAIFIIKQEYYKNMTLYKLILRTIHLAHNIIYASLCIGIVQDLSTAEKL